MAHDNQQMSSLDWEWALESRARTLARLIVQGAPRSLTCRQYVLMDRAMRRAFSPEEMRAAALSLSEGGDNA